MLIPIIIMSTMGVLFGLGLAFASRIFKVETNPKIERILSSLPGSNCGACGKAGCAGMADAIVRGDASLTSCPVGGEDVYGKIADILGVKKEATVKRMARVRCGGGKNAKDKYRYEGVKTCAAVSLAAGGKKMCGFGCLGFGDCVRACPFDAIHMGEGGVPVVSKDKCTACGSCVTACPKNIISIEKASERYYVKCLSRDKAVFVKSACSSGCIGCKICTKLSKGAFIVEDNLSRLDYAAAHNEALIKTCIEKCPVKCIIERS